MKKRVWISYLMVLFSLPLLYAQNTSIPDQNFEQALIDLAIDSDGVVNGEVLTDDINTITQLDIANKNISTLNGIEDFEALEVLNCSYNNISSLDLSNNTALTSVNCRSNMLTALNVKNGNNDDLVTLNALDNIDLKCIQADAEATPTGDDWQIHENITSYSTNCHYNETEIVDPNLEKALIELGLDSTTDVNDIDGYVPTTNIDNLLVLDISGKSITDLSGIEDFRFLRDLNCSNNELTELDSRSNDYLESVNCSNNQITVLDFSQNNNLTNLDCSDNDLSELSIKNNNNRELETFNATNNPNLNCIEVDNDFAPNGADTGWQKDTTATYTQYCNVTAIGDENFETYLETHDVDGNEVTIGSDDSMGNGIENDGWVSTTQIENVRLLNISDQGILDISGIEYFKALEDLRCSNNSLSNLNLNNNTELSALDCSNNQLTGLDLSNNTALTDLNCSNNQLTNTLDLNSHDQLKHVSCASNQLTSIVLDNNDLITTLNCAENQIPDLDLLNGNGEAMHPLLKILICSKNQLTTLDVSKNIYLISLGVSSNQLKVLNVTENIELKDLSCASNQLIIVNVDENLLLESLDVSSNIISSLDVSVNDKITSLDISGNKFSSIEINNLSNLTSFNCNNNQLVTLNMSSFSALAQLSCKSNQLLTLNIKNGNNTNLITFNALDNPNLYCIEIDNINDAKEYWFKDPLANYSETCSAVTYVPDINFETYLETHDKDGNEVNIGDPSSLGDGVAINNFVLTDRISIVTSMNVSNLTNTLSDLTGIEDFTALQDLNCSNNLLVNLDLSSNIALTTLNCSNNSLSDLKVNSNQSMEELYISKNQFSEFNYDEFLNLKIFICNNNQIAALDLSSHGQLTDLNCAFNQLVILNLKNGMNAQLTSMNAQNNPNLSCIEVDDPVAANNGAGFYGNWIIDPAPDGPTYSDTCATLTYIPDDSFETYLETHDKDGNVVGIDDPFNMGDGKANNNFVLTDRISIVTNLDVSNLAPKIADLTGLEDFMGLQNLNCSSNVITHLDLSSISDLTILDCSENSLTSLSVKNGNNVALTAFTSTSNPNLYCIEVDDPDAANAALGWEKDDQALYNGDCGSRQTLIPDSNFEQALIDLGYDTGALNGSVPTSNIEILRYLDVSEKYIADISGIEDFVSLDSLSCFSNYLKTINIQDNHNLIKLNCGNNLLNELIVGQNLALNTLIVDSNHLKSIDINSLQNLKVLDCSSNLISNENDLDLSNNSHLTRLICANNKLTSIDVTNNGLLVDIDCSDNFLTDIVLSQNTALARLNCSQNYLPNLDVSTNTVLLDVECNSNKIDNLDFSTNSSLLNLNCNDNKITDINVNKSTELFSLFATNNKLTTLDITNNEALTNLNCDSNDLNSLDIQKNVKLQVLSCKDNKISELILENNMDLKTLNVDNNMLDGLVVSQNINLEVLTCSNNKIEDLDLKSNTSLTILNIDNQAKEQENDQGDIEKIKVLTTLDLHMNTSLENLSCSNNKIEILDLGNNTELTSVNCVSNALQELNLRNGQNSKLSKLYATDNADLTCIEVDDPAATDQATTDGEWQKDATASYSDNCHYNETYVPDDNFEAELSTITGETDDNDDYIKTDKINTILNLDISNKGITDLTGIQDFTALEILDCSLNQLDSLNITHNAALITLKASENQLDRLFVSDTTAIENLDIAGNQFTEINLSKFSSLKEFNCVGNQFIDIDVDSNTELITLNCNSNQLSDLDLSNNTNLIALDCSFNELVTLKVNNGNNDILTSFNALNNPNLTCIEVDDPAASDQATGWQKDDTASYNEDCHYNETFVPDDAFEQALIDLGYDPEQNLDDYVPTNEIRIITSLLISNKGISDLTGLHDFESLVYLNCSNNDLTDLDISSNLLLENLNCSANQLTYFDFASNHSLIEVNIADNLFTEIDISGNLGLKKLTCSSNALTSLDITQNPNLEQLFCNNNQLISVDANNGFNSILIDFDSRDNQNLRCILVDDIAAAESYVNWFKDESAAYKLECDDDDNDGIQDEEDLCPNTPFGEPVDLFGCAYFILPANNFTILITGETCISSNNGIINISAIETYNYTATIVGADFNNAYNFTNTVEIRNLRSGSYQLCITVEGEPDYIICYEIIITEPEALLVSSRISRLDEKISLELSGGINYTIDFNGLIFDTTDTVITLSLSSGANTIKIKTDSDCQGIYEENIFLSNGLFFYPNPFENLINVFIGNNESGKIAINIYSNLGQLVLSKTLFVQEGFVIIDASYLSSGIYIISLKSNTSLSTFKIVKK